MTFTIEIKDLSGTVIYELTMRQCASHQEALEAFLEIGGLELPPAGCTVRAILRQTEPA